MSSLYALVPARGGSKTVPQKNILPLMDQPLIAYTLQAANAAEVFDKVYVSSDDDQILAVANYYGAEKFKRDPHLGLNEATLDSVVAEFIHRTKPDPKDIIALLLPTSPLRTSRHIRDAVAEFKDFPTCRCLISVYEISSKYFNAYVGGGEFLHPLSGEHVSYMKRQDLPSLYLPNRAIYIFRINDFLIGEKIPETHLVPFLMSEEDSLEVSCENDFAKAESGLERK
jgi:CMP-N,N'-diacetyllegionaminic acid synthase